MNKAKAQVRHFIRRARERFGVRLNREGVREIVKMIQQNELPHVGSQSTARTAFLIPVGDGREAVLIYDKNRQTPRTILTREMWEAREGQIEARA